MTQTMLVLRRPAIICESKRNSASNLTTGRRAHCGCDDGTMVRQVNQACSERYLVRLESSCEMSLGNLSAGAFVSRATVDLRRNAPRCEADPKVSWGVDDRVRSAVSTLRENSPIQMFPVQLRLHSRASHLSPINVFSPAALFSAHRPSAAPVPLENLTSWHNTCKITSARCSLKH